MKKMHFIIFNFLILNYINAHFSGVPQSYNNNFYYYNNIPHYERMNSSYSGSYKQFEDSYCLWSISGILSDKIIVKEHENHFSITINLPGFTTNNIIISRFDKNIKVIVQPSKTEATQTLVEKRPLEGTISFRTPIQIDKVRSDYVKDVLTIIVPKGVTTYRR